MRLTLTTTTGQIRSDPVPTAIMAAGVWLLLSVTMFEAMSERGVHMEAPPLTPPIRNLSIDPAQRRLTWEWGGGGTRAEGGALGPRFLCRKEGRDPVRADPAGHSCSFPALSHCHVTNFTVFPEGQEKDAAHLCFQPRDPNRAAAARNLHCWVHDVDWLSCRWGRGPGATRDVRYRMFLRDARHSPDHDRECPRYEVDSQGSRVGCAVGEAGTLASLITVTVNGSGGAHGVHAPVSCTDADIDMAAVEVLAPPVLTAECESTGARVRWAPQSRFQTAFVFTLQINQSSQTEPKLEMVYETEIKVPTLDTVSVRVKATALDSGVESDWSKAWSLDCGPTATLATPMTSLLLAGAGAVLTVMAVLLLCWRKSLLSRLFPPIPRMRVLPGPEMVAWVEAPENCEVTLVTDN